MANEDQSNQDLNSALTPTNSQPSVPGNKTQITEILAHNVQPCSIELLVRPPTPIVTKTASNNTSH